MLTNVVELALQERDAAAQLEAAKRELASLSHGQPPPAMPSGASAVTRVRTGAASASASSSSAAARMPMTTALSRASAGFNSARLTAAEKKKQKAALKAQRKAVSAAHIKKMKEQAAKRALEPLAAQRDDNDADDKPTDKQTQGAVDNKP